MTPPAEHHKKSPVSRKLRKTLTFLAESTQEASILEAKEFVCTVCHLPVQPCKADARATCFHMFREGTELQELHISNKMQQRQCLSCGRKLSRRLMAQNPLAEVCSACARTSTRARKRDSSKGVTS